MTYPQFMAASQVLLEERIGAPFRRALAAEDAAVEATRKAIRETH